MNWRPIRKNQPDLERDFILAIHEYLDTGGYHPNLRRAVGHQIWVACDWDCDRRPAIARPNSGLAIEIDVFGSEVVLKIVGCERVDSVERRLWWPTVDLADPKAFEKIGGQIERFEKYVASSRNGEGIDEIALLSALAPRPTKMCELV